MKIKFFNTEMIVYNFPIVFYSFIIFDFFVIFTSRLNINPVLILAINLQMFPVFYVVNYIVIFILYRFFFLGNYFDFVTLFIQYLFVILVYFLFLFFFSNGFSIPKIYNESSTYINFYPISGVISMYFYKDKIFESRNT